MSDYHRPYHRDLRPPPSSVPDPTVFHGNGYFSSASPQANGYFSSAPKDGAFPGAGDRRIEIYTTAPPPLPPPPRLRKTTASGLRPPSASTVPSPRRASYRGASPSSSEPRSHVVKL
ncbi:translation initiation factor IF-2-like [Hordeum vulgare]|nr:translation initiation factor IF-2-like [Hordeum vulgare]